MLCSLFSLASCKKPVVLIPGLFGSRLRGDVTKKRYWYCPIVHDEEIWFNERYLIPPTYYCMFDDMRMEWDEKNKNVKQPDYVNLTTIDFGGVTGFNNVDTSAFGIHLVPYYEHIIERLEKIGYIVGTDLFGAPNDWRRGVLQVEQFWTNLTKLIENAYNKNHEKVFLIGHSMGGFIIDQLLSVRMSQEWVDKYIDSGIMITPSFGGSSIAYEALYSQKIPFFEFIGDEHEFVSSILGLHVHIPNKVAFENTTMGYKKNGEPIYSKDITNFLIQEGKLSGDYLKINELARNLYETAPPQPKAKIFMIYNSGIGTLQGIDFRNGGAEPINGPGDLIVNAEGPEYACKHWKNIQCKDVANVSQLYNHQLIVYQDDVIDMIINWMQA